MSDAVDKALAWDKLAEKNAEIWRLRGALREIIGLDHHNMGPESRATKIARDALTAPYQGDQ